jgi:hypothetical protein
MKTKGRQNRKAENTQRVAGELGDQTGTLSATLVCRLPDPLLFVKWEIKGCELNGLRGTAERAKLHAVLKQAFQKLYGYTSDAQGIRHALLDEPTLDVEDAKFMLVSCSAFVNYLVVKVQKAGIKI